MFCKRMIPVFVALLCLLVVSAAPVWGQAVSTGTVSGTVTDNTGAVVAGANVTIVDKATGDTRGTASNEVGHFIFQNVNPGSYTVKFKKAGFAELDVTDVTVEVGTQVNENVQMKLGAISTTVTVTETAGAELQTMNSTVGQTVSGVALDSLPSIGHDVVTFATLQPGVSPLGSVGGTVMDQSSFTLDGGNNTNDMDGGGQSYTPSFGGDPTGGVIAGSGLRGGNTTGGVPSGVMPTPFDGVEEIKVILPTRQRTSTVRPAARWRSSPGEVGTNGTAAATTTTGQQSQCEHVGQQPLWTPLPTYHYNFFGGRAGGPIVPKGILGDEPSLRQLPGLPVAQFLYVRSRGSDSSDASGTAKFRGHRIQPESDSGDTQRHHLSGYRSGSARHRNQPSSGGNVEHVRTASERPGLRVTGGSSMRRRQRTGV